MENSNPSILILSEDNVFIELFYRILKKVSEDIKIFQYQTIHGIKGIEDASKYDIIILDDVITGSASHEVVSYFRIEKQYLSIIYYFSAAEFEDDKKPIERGANYFFHKPFNPEEIEKHVKSTLKSLAQERIN